MKLNRKYVTPIISLVFVVVGLTGILMLFHCFDGYTEVLHELMGALLVVITIFHIIVNWKALKIHFRKGVIIPTTVSMIFLSVAFVNNQQQNPKVDTTILNRLIKAPINDAFRALNVDYADARKRLELIGISIERASTIESIWIENNANPEKVFDAILD